MTWKPIPICENYEVSSTGKVRNKHTTRVLKTWISSNGYENVELKKNKKKLKMSLHRLVAIAFIPNPAVLSDVHHKNGIKTDNRVSNLEWMSSRMNLAEMWISHLESAGYKIIRPDKSLVASST